MVKLVELPSPYCIVKWEHPDYGNETTVLNLPDVNTLDDYSSFIRRLTQPEVLLYLRDAYRRGELK